MKKLLYILFVLMFSVNAYSQIDTEFWFAFPDITSGDYGAENSIDLCLASFDKAATIHVSQPADAPGFNGIDTIVYLPPNSVVTLDWGRRYKSQLETLADLSFPTGVPFGLLIRSDNSISAYYANTSNDSEAYIFKGKNALGEDFLVPMQYEYRSGSYASAFNSIEILATEDDTKISVELSQWTTSPLQTSKNQTIEITLNRGWSYAFAARGGTGAEHLHNTRIKSDKPIVVNSTDDSVEPGDLVGDQLIPVEKTGVEYVAVRNFGNIEKVYIFPTEKNTSIWIDGILQSEKLNVGDKLMVDLLLQTYDATYIVADKPITVFQITSKRNSKELGGTQLPSILCTGSTETVYRPAFKTAEIVLDLITRASYTDSFTLNGQTGFISPSDFSPVHGNPEYAFARIILDSNTPVIQEHGGVIRIKNTDGVFHAGALDSPIGNNSCTYGYFSDFRELELNISTDKSVYFDGDDIVLSILNSEALKEIVWTTPNNEKLTGNPIVIKNATEADAGTYMVNADSKEGCVIPDAGFIVIDVFQEKLAEHIVCRGDEVELKAFRDTPYSWINDKGEVFAETESITVAPEESSEYRITSYAIGQSVAENGNFQLGNNFFESDLKYGGTNSTAIATPGHYSVWKVARDVNGDLNRVYDHTTGSSTDGLMFIANVDGQADRHIWKKTFRVTPNTKYKLSAWFITPKTAGDQLSLDFAFNEQKQGKNITPPYTKVVSGPELWKKDSVYWDSGNRNTVTVSIVTNQSNAANVCIDDIEFTPFLPVTDSIAVHVIEAPQPVIQGDNELCKGVALLDAGKNNDVNDYASYAWYKSGSNEVIGTERILTVNEPGEYQVEVSNGFCLGSASFVVDEGDVLHIEVDSKASFCPGDEYLVLNYSVEDETPAIFDLIFDQRAQAAGFAHLIDQSVDNDEGFVIPLPRNVNSGVYYADLIITGSSVCEPVARKQVQFNVEPDAGQFISQKWNNVLALYNQSYNGGFDVVSYQWYKNGEVLEGESRSNLYLGEGVSFDLEDKYAVLLTLRDGSEIMTCDYYPELKDDQVTFPNMVQPGQVIELPGAVNGEAVFWNMSGIRYSSQQIRGGHASIVAPVKKGWYLLEFVSDDVKQKYKIVVQ